ncbi:MAG: hypothetical protein K2J82_05495 [Muribaculaceae bacterium]|nr:hypothetical protein [Muribaculaceae bacterium]
MIITKELYRDKPVATNLYPVIVRVRHLGKEKIVFTSVNVFRKHWDSRHCTVNRHDSSHKIKNEIIESTFRRVAGNIQNYIDDFLTSNLDDIIKAIDDDRKPTQLLPHPDISSLTCHQLKTLPTSSATTFAGLIREKIDSSRTLNTRRGYETLLRYYYLKFEEGPFLNNMTTESINVVLRQIENDYSKASTMKRVLSSKLNAVINYGKENGHLPPTFSPRIPFYPIYPADRNLSAPEIKTIYHLYLKKISEDPKFREVSTLALGLFILDIAFQGLAPVDLSELKISDLSFPVLHSAPNYFGNNIADSIRAVKVTTCRKKTSQPVTITAAYQPIKHILDYLMRDKDPDDYLIPCFSKYKSYSETQRQSRLANFFRKVSVNLNKAINGLKLPEHNTMRPITFYFARHAFCNLIDSLDVPRHIIQHMIGHRTSVLEKSYLRTLTDYEQASLSQKLFHLLI